MRGRIDMTNKLDELALQTFLDNQEQLFPEPVADTPEEAEAFLEDCLAVVLDNKRDVIDYIGDSMDIEGMTDEEVLDSPEVFALEDGRYLVIMG